MSEAQAAALRVLFKLMRPGETMWYCRDIQNVQRVSRIDKHDDEEGLVAYCIDGGYWALDNGEPSDFEIMRPVNLGVIDE